MNAWIETLFIACGISILFTGVFLLRAATQEDNKSVLVSALVSWYLSFFFACMAYVGIHL